MVKYPMEQRPGGYVMIPEPKLLRIEYTVDPYGHHSVGPMVASRAHHKMERLVGTFAFHNAAFPFIQRIRVHFALGDFRLQFDTRPVDRDVHGSGRLGEVEVRFQNSWSAHFVADSPDERLVVVMREMLFECVRHEMDESIYVDGVRRFDPHAREEHIRGKSFDQVIVDDPLKETSR